MISQKRGVEEDSHSPLYIVILNINVVVEENKNEPQNKMAKTCLVAYKLQVLKADLCIDK